MCGEYAWIVFTAVYAISTVFCFPVGIFTVASGFIFGFWIGTLLSWLGSIAGAAMAFGLGQQLFHSYVEQHLVQSYPRFPLLSKAISQNGWKIVFLVRFSPLLPFNVLNYLLSITDVTFSDYTTATASGLLIPTALWVYVGTAAKGLNDSFSPSSSPLQTSILLISGLITVVSIVFVTQISAKMIKREFEKSDPTTKDIPRIVTV